MEILLLTEGDQRWDWSLGGDVVLTVTSHIRPVAAPDNTPGIKTPIVMTLQTDFVLSGCDGKYYLVGTYGSTIGKKIEGEFKNGVVTTLNLQPGDYEIVINNGSGNIIGKLASFAGVG